MLDPWIIEQIRRREEEERRQHERRPMVELPLQRDDRPPPSRESGRQGGNHGSDRGVVILDYKI